MPIKEYRCRSCGHSFKKVFFQDEEERDLKCPRCCGCDVAGDNSSPGLFKGISNFSVLTGDSN